MYISIRKAFFQFLSTKYSHKVMVDTEAYNRKQLPKLARNGTEFETI